jgi:hypothetical protein
VGGGRLVGVLTYSVGRCYLRTAMSISTPYDGDEPYLPNREGAKTFVRDLRTKRESTTDTE